MAATVQSIDLITTDPAVRNGRPCIAGTTIEVATIAIDKVVHGMSADTIAGAHALSLPQVYAALAYYYANKAAIDTSIHERDQLAVELRERRVGSRRQALFG